MILNDRFVKAYCFTIMAVISLGIAIIIFFEVARGKLWGAW